MAALFLVQIIYAQDRDEILDLQDRCQNGDLKKCLTLGVRYQEGKGVKRNYSKALEAYAVACDSGERIGCFNIGIMYQLGLGVARNYNEAFQNYVVACESEYARACFNVAVYHLEGVSVPKNKEKSLEFFKKSCDLGYSRGCQEFNEVTKSSTKADQLARREICWQLVEEQVRIDRRLERIGRSGNFTRCIYRHPHRSFEGREQVDVGQGESCPKYPYGCQ